MMNNLYDLEGEKKDMKEFLEEAQKEKGLTDQEKSVLLTTAVVHPSHYNWMPGIECVDVAQWFTFNLGSVIKYVWRSQVKEKHSKIEDLEKAIFYLKLEIEMMENDTRV